MIKPLHDKIVLEPIEPIKETDSGIIVPDNAKSMKEPVAFVLAVGTHEDIKLEIGDKVIFDPSSLMQLRVGEEEHMIIPYRSIIAVIGKKS